MKIWGNYTLIKTKNEYTWKKVEKTLYADAKTKQNPPPPSGIWPKWDQEHFTIIRRILCKTDTPTRQHLQVWSYWNYHNVRKWENGAAE